MAAKGETQTRGDLVATIAANHGIPQTQVDGIIRDFESHIIKSLSGGGEIRLNGFGSFKVSQRAARTARNPQTGAPIKVAARKVARFSPAKVMKDSVAGAKGGNKSAAKAPAKAAGKSAAKAPAKATAAKTSGKSVAAKGGSKSSGVHKAAVTLGRTGSKGGSKKAGK